MERPRVVPARSCRCVISRLPVTLPSKVREVSQPEPRVRRIHAVAVLAAFVLSAAAAVIGYLLIGGIGGVLAGMAVAVLPFAVAMPIAILFDARRINRRDRGPSSHTSNGD